MESPRKPLSERKGCGVPATGMALDMLGWKGKGLV